MRLADVPDGEAVFFFLREPVSRYISGFYSRQRKGAPRYYFEWSKGEETAFGMFNTPNELACALSDPDPMRKLAAEKAMASIQHVRMKYAYWFDEMSYFRTRRNDIIFVGFQERLVEDFERLKLRLGLPVEIALPDDNIRSHRNPVNLDRNLDDIALRNLNFWYADDIRFYKTCQMEFGPLS